MGAGRRRLPTPPVLADGRLWPQFADAFQGADVLFVTDVYPAGEAARPGITGRLIADAVRAAHPEADVRYVPMLDEAAAELRKILRPGDLCLTLGAGDVTTLPDRLLAPGAGRVVTDPARAARDGTIPGHARSDRRRPRPAGPGSARCGPRSWAEPSGS